MNIKNEMLTFKQFFRTSFLLLLPCGILIFPRIIPFLSKNNLILSLFLSLCFAAAYVMALYTVVTKSEVWGEPAKGKNGQNRTKTCFALIFGIRMTIRIPFLLYFFCKLIKSMIPVFHSTILIALPVLAMFLMFACQGIKALASFGEAIFWSGVITMVVLVICIFPALDLSNSRELLQMGFKGDLFGETAGFIRGGYFLFCGLACVEPLVYMYILTEKREKNMIVSSLGIPIILAIIGLVIVINVAGFDSLQRGDRTILNVVGALKFPGTEMSHLGLFVFYAVILGGIMIIGTHFTMVGGWFKELCDRYRWVIFFYGILILLLMALIYKAPVHFNKYRGFGLYLAAIDLPLSILVPALSMRKKVKTSVYARKIVEGIIIIFLVTGGLTGCAYHSVEDVDYLNVVIIEDVGSFKFVVEKVTGPDNSQATKSYVYSCKASSFRNACNLYNKTHDKYLDTTHTSYIVVENKEVFKPYYEEFTDKFKTCYVEVIIKPKVLEHSGENDIESYIKMHYKGESLAKLRM